MDLISIILPAFNAEQTIAQTINSLLLQTYNYFELIIVNDGSTDDTEVIINSIVDNRIQYFKQDNKGQCAACNFGLTKAKGKYIKFFDADDVMNNTHLEAQILKLNGRIDAVSSCKWGRFYNDNLDTLKFVPETVWKDMNTLDWLRGALTQRHDMMGGCLWLIPKSILDKIGGWDERLSLNNDFEFSVRLLLNTSNVFFAENAELHYRSGALNSLSKSTSEEKYEAAFLSNYLGCSYLLKADNSNEMKLLCANRFQEWVFDIYPKYPEVVKKFERQIKLWGGSTIKMQGGIILKFLTKVLGWKNSKKIKLFLNKNIKN